KWAKHRAALEGPLRVPSLGQEPERLRSEPTAGWRSRKRKFSRGGWLSARDGRVPGIPWLCRALQRRAQGYERTSEVYATGSGGERAGAHQDIVGLVRDQISPAHTSDRWRLYRCSGEDQSASRRWSQRRAWIDLVSKLGTSGGAAR